MLFDTIPEGAYLRGMNALGSLHRHKQTALTAIRPGAILRCWKTLEEIEEEDEDIYDEIMEALTVTYPYKEEKLLRRSTPFY
jgi:hypothetical protein